MRENTQNEYKSPAKRNIKAMCGECKYILYRDGQTQRKQGDVDGGSDEGFDGGGWW